MSAYDAIAELYDPWSRTVTEDVDFYVAEARKARSTVVELGVGTGRIASRSRRAGRPGDRGRLVPGDAGGLPRARRRPASSTSSTSGSATSASPR